MVAFDEVAEKITDAARQIEPDREASPVLVAVVPGVPGEACEGSRCSALGGVHYGLYRDPTRSPARGRA